jgi:hypothetical protein
MGVGKRLPIDTVRVWNAIFASSNIQAPEKFHPEAPIPLPRLGERAVKSAGAWDLELSNLQK